MEKTEARHRTGEKRKRRSSPNFQRIKFFHGLDTEQAKEAKTERASRQLLVKGLPMNGPHEKILNDLMEGLGKKNLGEDGFNVVQGNIIGAHRLPPSPGEKTATTRITLDSRDTKLNIRLAAERNKRWGNNGTHLPFFRDITLDLRKRKNSKSEDTNVPRKDKYQETPRKGGGNLKEGVSHPTVPTTSQKMKKGQEPPRSDKQKRID